MKKCAGVCLFSEDAHRSVVARFAYFGGKFVGREDLIDSVCARTDSLTAIQTLPRRSLAPLELLPLAASHELFKDKRRGSGNVGQLCAQPQRCA